MQRRDDSPTLYIQHEAPEGGKGAEWISAPAGPSFMTGCFCLQRALLGRSAVTVMVVLTWEDRVLPLWRD